MKLTIDRITAVVRLAFASLAGLSMALIFIAVFANSVSRYFFGSSLLWGEETAKFAMVYGTVFGMLAAYTSGLNVRFSIFVDLCPERVSRYLTLVTHLVAITLGVAFTVSALGFIARRGAVISPGLGIEMKYPQAAMLVAGAGLVLVSALKLCETIMLLRTGSGRPASR